MKEKQQYLASATVRTFIEPNAKHQPMNPFPVNNNEQQRVQMSATNGNAKHTSS